jgi:hypothetical protein
MAPKPRIVSGGGGTCGKEIKKDVQNVLGCFKDNSHSLQTKPNSKRFEFLHF